MEQAESFDRIAEILVGLNSIHNKEKKFLEKHNNLKKVSTKNVSANFTRQDVQNQLHYQNKIQEHKPLIINASSYNPLQKMKIKSYSPQVFSLLNEKKPVINYESFIHSPNLFGKSGSKIFFSSDGKYVVKTIRYKEYKTLKEIIFSYFNYRKDDKNSLLCNYFGLYRLNGENSTFFTIMNNFLPINKSLRIYDLKGSLFLRKSRNKCVLKDQDWRDNREYLHIEHFDNIKKKLEKDTKFLRKNEIMDYSLLVGILDKKNIPQRKSPEYTNELESNNENSKSEEIFETLTSKNRSNIILQIPGLITESSTALLETEETIPIQKLEKQENQIEFFFIDLKRSKRKRIESLDFNVPFFESQDEEYLYFLGIIDVLTKWDIKKALEHLIYRILCIENFSSVDPKAYSKRFMEMVKDRLFSEK